MHQIIQMDLSATTSETRFTLDELVLKIRELFTQRGMAAVANLILKLVDELLAIAHTTGTLPPAQQRPCPCGQGSYELKDRLQRSLRTSIGTLHLAWRRLRCRHCQKTFVPLRQFLGLEAWQRRTSELEQVAVEVVSEQNYRRASRHLDVVGQIPVPKSTLHRWVVDSQASQWELPEEKPPILMADGTGYKRRPQPAAKLTNAGEVRVVVGRRADGKWIPYGAWSGQSWAEIGQALRGSGPEPALQAQVLVSDGEQGLAQALASLANRQQRCGWHVVRDLPIMLWHDQAPSRQRQAYTAPLAQLVGIELPAGDLEVLRPQDKVAVQERVAAAQTGLRQLVGQLLAKGYEKAAHYIQSAQDKLFGYVEFWLETGVVCPRTTSFLERLMRELGRRLKRIAFGWSQTGAAQVARLILRRIVDPEEWQSYWKQRLGLDDNVHLSLRAVKTLKA